MARLYFPPGPKQGFTSDTTSRHEASPYHVIRELLQNCLDGAKDAHREAEISLTIDELPLDEIPGISEYITAFERAREGRGAIQQTLGQSASNHETVVIEQIGTQLAKSTIPVFTCLDNGIGLDDNRLAALLAEGDTTKAGDATPGSLGSWGVGHLAAFAASDLRYVLYAGKSEGPGEAAELRAAGQAILASHQGEGMISGAHGFWLERYEGEQFDVPHEFVTDVPMALAGRLERVPTTGSLVLVAGFNRFGIDDSELVVEEIRRVVALNFLAALEAGDMRVTIEDPRRNIVESVDQAHLQEIVGGIADQRNARFRGQWSGSRAHRALSTLQTGRLLDDVLTNDLGVSVWFRELERDDAGRSSVHLFRDGMWITDNPLRLQPSDFDGVNPFDAVLSLRKPTTGTSELYRLVHDAEGAEHRDLRVKEIREHEDRQRFVNLLAEIAEALRSAAGEISEDASFTPKGFAQIEGSVVKSAADLPPLRPRSRTGTDPTVTPRRKGKRSKRRNPNNETPDEPAGVRPGRAVRMRRSMRGEAGSDGQITRIRVACQVETDSEHIGLRLRRDRGSDETCDLPFAPEWLQFREVLTGDESSVRPDGTGREVLLPASVTSFTIVLNDPIASAVGLDVDVVARRPDSGGQR